MKATRKFLAIILALALCLPMCIPSFAQGNRPLGVTEDEDWFPSNGIILMEDANVDCGKTSHLPPSGYKYEGYASGDSSIEATFAGGLCTIIGLVPGLQTVSATISVVLLSETMRQYLEYGTALGTYKKYVWSKNGSYWYHVVWTADSNGDGVKEYITCTVETYP